MHRCDRVILRRMLISTASNARSATFYVIVIMITLTLRFLSRYVTVAGVTFSFTLRYRSGRETHRGPDIPRFLDVSAYYRRSTVHNPRTLAASSDPDTHDPTAATPAGGP